MNEKDDETRPRQRPVKPDWKDYVAITIATFETTLLPLVLVLLFLVALLFLVTLLIHY